MEKNSTKLKEFDQESESLNWIDSEIMSFHHCEKKGKIPNDVPLITASLSIYVLYLICEESLGF